MVKHYIDGRFECGKWIPYTDVMDRDLKPTNIDDFKFIMKYNSHSMPKEHYGSITNEHVCKCSNASTYFYTVIGFTIGLIIGYLIGVVS